MWLDAYVRFRIHFLIFILISSIIIIIFTYLFCLMHKSKYISAVAYRGCRRRNRIGWINEVDRYRFESDLESAIGSLRQHCLWGVERKGGSVR